VKAWRAKLIKEMMKTKQLLEKQRKLENHNQSLETTNNTPSRNNLIFLRGERNSKSTLIELLLRLIGYE
jgi:hypothetical protein